MAMEAGLGLSRDVLHVLLGVGVQFTLVVLLRSWTGAVLPWLLLLLGAAANEAYDLSREVWPAGYRLQQWFETLKDLITTMAVPTLLLVVSRYAPRLLTPPAAAGAAASQRPEGNAVEAAPAPDALEVGEQTSVRQ